MLKREDVIDNRKFINRCDYYGLDYRDFDICNDTIILNTYNDNLYILFDRNFNIIDVAKTDGNGNFVNPKTTNIIAYGTNEIFSEFTTIPLGKNFQYINPILIIKAANRIILGQNDYGRSLRIKLANAWTWINEITPEQKYFFQIISYIKFLGEELEQFFMNSYHLSLIIDSDIHDSQLYLQNLIKKIDEYIDLCIDENEEPYPFELLNYLGKNKMDRLHELMLKDVIDLIIKDKGYVFNEKINSFEKIDSDIEENYTEIYNRLTELANLTDEDILEIQYERMRVSMELSDEVAKNLQERHNVDSLTDEETSPVLKKTK